MLSAEYLRRQADNCLRIARHCFDLSSVEQLRLMARDLRAKAAELDESERGAISSHTLECNTSTGKTSRT